MNTILVINSKGGVGKTTIATNLASYFAAAGVPTTIMDYDPQGSSLHWLSQRPSLVRTIHGANAAPQMGGGLRSTRMYVPHDTRQLIVDAPAGASKLLLQELLSKANSIVIPVAPSSLDVHGTAGFIKELLLSGRIRIRNIRLAVVANRVRRSRNVYEPLERFVQALDMEFLTRLSDSEIYIEAAESGVGVFEMGADVGGREREEFMPIVRWAERREFLTTHRSSEIVPFRPRHQRGVGLSKVR